MNQHSPLFQGSISHAYSDLLEREHTLSAMDQPPPKTDSDTCVPVPHSHPIADAPAGCIPTNDCARPEDDTDACTPPTESLPKDSDRVCTPTNDPPGDGADKPKYSALPAVQSGWTLPPQPRV